jgi:amino acid adenylation domain-containing protein
MKALQQLLEDSANRHPDNVAVEDPGRGEDITYRELNELSDRLRDDLLRHGVQASDRVGICARKSIAGLVSIFGILKAGAVYVPVAADAPDARNAYIFLDCSVKALVVDRSILEQAREGSRGIDLGRVQDCAALSRYGDELALVCRHGTADHMAARPGVPDNLAYILYTSGSTGTPKGVMHSHSSALSFVDWCSETFDPTQGDRFSSHAPFHFDLSIFDVFGAIKHGATLVLIGEQVGRQPMHLAALIAERQITIWYSTPSVLRLLVEYGRIERYDFSLLRLVLFAGEVFPHRHLKALMDRWPERRYFNLFGPTETNVCTFCEIPHDHSGDQTGPTSIGNACSGTLTRVMDEKGSEVRPGEQGELYVSGGTVMLGYWNRPDLNAKAFLVDGEGKRWFKTGDMVRQTDAGDYLFLGRRDRMVKRRGYRIELDEIESLLYGHPRINETAVIAFMDEEDNVQIKAFLCWIGEEPPSLVALKGYCSEKMATYLIPDQFSFLEAIPKTSTDKIDYLSLMRANQRAESVRPNMTRG